MPIYGTDDFIFGPPMQFCECCIRASTSVSSTSGHKWTEEEIKAELVSLARELAFTSWFNRGDVRRRMKHWTDKLDRLESAKEEFALVEGDTPEEKG